MQQIPALSQMFLQKGYLCTDLVVTFINLLFEKMSRNLECFAIICVFAILWNKINLL